MERTEDRCFHCGELIPDGTDIHVTVDGADYFAYHAWHNAGNGTNLASAGRSGLIDRIRWVDGWPQIGDGTPSNGWQPWPGH